MERFDPLTRDEKVAAKYWAKREKEMPECVHGVPMYKPCVRCRADLLPIGPVEIVDLDTKASGCIYLSQD